jgi:hypothetical protein
MNSLSIEKFCSYWLQTYPSLMLRSPKDAERR